MKARRNRRPIVYPLFEEASAHSTDRYWIDILQAAARGRFPQRIFPREERLVFIHKNSERYLELPQDPIELAQVFIKFLQDNLGLRSDKDLECARLNAELLASMERCELSWNKLNKRARAWMLEQYSHRLVKKLSLTEEVRQQLVQVLLTGLYIGLFNSATIEYVDGKVLDVSGIVYRPKQKKFCLAPELLEKCTKKANKKLQEAPESCLLDAKHPAYEPRKKSLVKPLAEYLAKSEAVKKVSSSTLTKKKKPEEEDDDPFVLECS